MEIGGAAFGCIGFWMLTGSSDAPGLWCHIERFGCLVTDWFDLNSRFNPIG